MLVAPVLAVAVLASTGHMAASLPGLPDPGSVTRWGLPIARGLHDVFAMLTIGLLVVTATVLTPESGTAPGALSTLQARATRFAAVAATGWVVAGVFVVAFTFADAAGVSAFAPGSGEQLFDFMRSFDLGRSMTAGLLLAFIVATGCWLATRLTTVGLMAVVALAACFPIALGGHAAGAGNHDSAVNTQLIHLVGVTVWVGGLAALALLPAASRNSVSLRRYSALAGWCFGLVAVSGVVAAIVRLGSWSGLRSTYGVLLVAKAICLVGLGAAGWWQRRRILQAYDETKRARAFLRLAATELFVMAVASGLAVALSRTSPSRSADGNTLPTPTEALLGYPMPHDLTSAAWFTQWRLDMLWTPLAILGAVWYILAVVRLYRRGDSWPISRALAWGFGCLLLVWVTSGAPGLYGRVLFSMHMVQHMLIAMAVPIFLVLGGPISLALRTVPARRDGSRGPREWLLMAVNARYLALFTQPVVAAFMLVGSLVIFYYSGLFELALRTHTGHVLMTLHFLLAGYVFAWVICGIDPGPQRPPHIFRVLLLVASMAFHAFFSVAMMTSNEVLGRTWFNMLDRDWGPSLVADQHRGGGIAWALGEIPVLILLIAAAWAWLKSDEREARRYDRQAERDGDAELAAYNAYLQKLADRESR
jgi:putative copper resistance protein D